VSAATPVVSRLGGRAIRFLAVLADRRSPSPRAFRRPSVTFRVTFTGGRVPSMSRPLARQLGISQREAKLAEPERRVAQLVDARVVHAGR
jgi:hypothetical protein